MNRRVWLPAVGLLIGSLILLALPLAPCRFLGGLVILLVFPFYPSAARVASSHQLSISDALLLAFTFGLVFSPCYLFPLKALAYNRVLLLGVPVALGLLNHLASYLRTPRGLVPGPKIPLLAQVAVVVFLALYAIVMINVGLLNPNGSYLLPLTRILQNPYQYFVWTFNFDFFKHLAFTNELSRAAPLLPLNPYMSSEGLHYYWFYHLIAAGLYHLTGINVVQVQVGLAFALTIGFIVSTLLILRRFTSSPAALVAVALLLGLSQSYEYLRPLICPREIGFDGILSANFWRWLVQRDNVDWIVSKYHHFIRNYMFLQHVVAGMLIGMWATFLVLRGANARRLKALVVCMFAVIVMYNTFIFIAFMAALSLFLFTSVTPENGRARTLWLVAASLLPVVDLKFIALPFFIILVTWFQPQPAGGWRRLGFLVLIGVLGIGLLQALISPENKGKLGTFSAGLNINDVRGEIGHAGEGLFKALDKGLWDVIGLTAVLAVLVLSPFLFLLLLQVNRRTLLLLISAAIVAAGLLFAPAIKPYFPGVQNKLDIDGMSVNTLSIFLYLWELGPAFPLAVLAMALIKEDNKLFHFCLLGSVLTLIALNMGYIVNLDDFQFKVSVVNKLFLCLLAALGVGEYYPKLREQSVRKQVAALALAFPLFTLAIPQLLQDITQHIDARTSCFTLDPARAAVASWVKANTPVDAVVQSLPVPVIMDAFHHIIPVFFDRRAAYADPWHAIFGTELSSISRVRQVLTIAVHNPSSAMIYWALKTLEIDYLFVYNHEVAIQRMLERLMNALPYKVFQTVTEKEFSLYQVQDPSRGPQYETVSLPKFEGEEDERLTFLDIPFVRCVRKPPLATKQFSDTILKGELPLTVKLFYRITTSDPVRVTVQIYDRSWETTSDGYIEFDAQQLQRTRPALIEFTIYANGNIVAPSAIQQFAGAMKPLPRAGYISLIPHHANGSGLGGINYKFRLDSRGGIVLRPRGFINGFETPPRLSGLKVGEIVDIVVNNQKLELHQEGTSEIAIDREGVSKVFVLGNVFRAWESSVLDPVHLGDYEVVYENGINDFFPITAMSNYFRSDLELELLIERNTQGEQLFVGPVLDQHKGREYEIVRVLRTEPRRKIMGFRVHSADSKNPIHVTGLTLEYANDEL